MSRTSSAPLRAGRAVGSLVLTGLVSITAGSTPAWAGFQIDGKPKVSFYAEGSPGALDIEGKTSDLDLVDDGSTLSFTVPLESLDSGIDLRDSHMKEKYLEVETFPEAKLSFSRSELTLPEDVGASTTGTLQATFQVHGVDAPVSVSYELKRSKSGYKVDASFEYDASEHGIAIPKYLGITVAPEQKTRVRFDMVEQ